jgi:hypothetical protein
VHRLLLLGAAAATATAAQRRLGRARERQLTFRSAQR